MSDLRDHELISLQEAKRRISYRKGWKSLLNELTAIELATGARFVDRKKRRRYWRYRVTIAAIKEHAPRLVGKRRVAPAHGLEIRKFEEALSVLDQKIDDVCSEVFHRQVNPQILALKKRLLKVEQTAGKEP